MSDEYEIKLRLAPEQCKRVGRSPALRSLLVKRGIRRRLSSTYFDTEALALAARGAALRVRQLGRTHVQTLKLPIGGPFGIQAFRELETPLAGDVPLLWQLDRELAAQLAADGGGDQLVPIFGTEFDRTSWMARLDGSDIEVSLDVGEITAGDRRLPLHEVELELKSGSPAGLFALALRLHGDVPASWEVETKSARGYRLAADWPPGPERATSPGLTGEMSARTAFTAIVASCMGQMRANEACAILGQDAEGVHQLRVGLRRLRACIGAYRDTLAPPLATYLKTELDWLQQQLGPARDWDVFRLETLDRLGRRVATDPAVVAMSTAVAGLREESYAVARKALAEARHTEFMLRLAGGLVDGSWAAAEAAAVLDAPARDHAERLLSKRLKNIYKLGGKHAELEEGDLHRLRLSCKKLRYLSDFFRDFYSRRAAIRFGREIAAVQDCLGSLNDALVARTLLPMLRSRVAEASDGGLADRAVALVVGWQAARIDNDLAGLRRAWKRLRRCKPFWV